MAKSAFYEKGGRITRYLNWNPSFMFLRILRNFQNIPSQHFLFKVNNENTRTMCKICLSLTIQTPERRGVIIVNSEHISHIGLVFSLLTFISKCRLGNFYEMIELIQRPAWWKIQAFTSRFVLSFCVL